MSDIDRLILTLIFRFRVILSKKLDVKFTVSLSVIKTLIKYLNFFCFFFNEFLKCDTTKPDRVFVLTSHS